MDNNLTYYQKEYCANPVNKQRAKECRREWYQKNRRKELLRYKERYKNDVEFRLHFKEYQKEYGKKYYSIPINKQHRKEYWKEYYQKNREKLLLRSKAQYKNNKEKAKEHQIIKRTR